MICDVVRSSAFSAPLRFKIIETQRRRERREKTEEISFLEQGIDIRLGIEDFQVLELLADADELDRQAGLLLDAEDRSSLGGAVELGQDDAGAFDGLLEVLGLGDGVLS